MDSALIVSSSEKSAAFFSEMLSAAAVGQIVTLGSCAGARRLLLERDFDLVIIDAPLRDETGESLSRHIASKGLSQVILAVSSALFEEISAVTEELGVLTVSKPINRDLFWAALKLAKSVGSRRRSMGEDKLRQRIEDIRRIDRAKCILISHLGMSEPEAHRYIEKQAMDMRVTKRAVAEGILKTYEN